MGQVKTAEDLLEKLGIRNDGRSQEERFAEAGALVEALMFALEVARNRNVKSAREYAMRFAEQIAKRIHRAERVAELANEARRSAEAEAGRLARLLLDAQAQIDTRSKSISQRLDQVSSSVAALRTKIIETAQLKTIPEVIATQ